MTPPPPPHTHPPFFVNENPRSVNKKIGDAGTDLGIFTEKKGREWMYSDCLGRGVLSLKKGIYCGLIAVPVTMATKGGLSSYHIVG